MQRKTTVTAQLIFSFVFAYVKIWFSHDAVHCSSIPEDHPYTISKGQCNKFILGDSFPLQVV